MRITVRSVNRLLITGQFLLTFCLIIFNEYLVYHINRRSWPKIPCKSKNCTRVLLIADPQLLGRTYNKQFYNTIALLDSDRYLRKTFELALDFTRPDVICFLGDLLDEGNIASTHDFQSYVKRFRSIYQEKQYISYIHLPGDNDIGGEGGEPVLNTNINRFKEAFTSNDILDYNNTLRFFRINSMSNNLSDPDHENNKHRLRVGLSHIPLLAGGGNLIRSTINQLDPHVIFSGHWHESRITFYPSTRNFKYQETNAVRYFDLWDLKWNQHSFLEITVPTASYRMGKKRMGLGYAVFENYNLNYVVLWLPNRFFALLIYIYWILIIISIYLVLRMINHCLCRANKSSKHYYNFS